MSQVCSGRVSFDTIIFSLVCQVSHVGAASSVDQSSVYSAGAFLVDPNGRWT